MQTTSHILMIRPVHFTFNDQTAVNNAFQVRGSEAGVQQKALHEFDHFVATLRSNGIDVMVVEDTPEPHTPDSIFPNNWISFHDDATVVLYPMYAVNRRLERKPAVIQSIEKSFHIVHIIDLSFYEEQKKFLEGTGSLVLDRDQKIAYACLSPRTNKDVLDDFCERLGYQPVVFHAVDKTGSAIYHTNVMMCVGERFVLICMESITSPAQQEAVSDAIAQSGKQLIAISLQQMNAFAGNMLQVNDRSGNRVLVMSSRAFHSLTEAQLNLLRNQNRIVHADLETIETNGGGSARCMMAEVHLPIRK